MKKNILIPTLILGFIFIGCSTKREYFDPKKDEIVGKIVPSYSLNSKISTSNIEAATLKDGRTIITSGIIEGLKLEKGESLIGVKDTKYLISNIDGKFRILNADKKVIFQRNFPQAVVSANISGDNLALLTANNQMYLVKISSNSIISRHDAGEAIGDISKVAQPFFMENLIVFPTLNGKLYLMDQIHGGIIQNILISNEQFFNNIIFLKIIGNSIYAATPTRIMLISSNGNKFINEDIKTIISDENNIYTFLSDGTIKKYDLNLNLLTQNKFKFAIYSNAVIVNNHIYVLEKTGYIIKLDLNLSNPQIFKSIEIDDRTFAYRDGFFVGNKEIKILK